MNRTETAGPHPGRFDVRAGWHRAIAVTRRSPRAPPRRGPGASRGCSRPRGRPRPGGELRAPGRHLPEPVRGDGHAGQRIVDVGVEPGRDDQEPRLERLHRRLDDGAKGVGVHGVARAGRRAGCSRRSHHPCPAHRCRGRTATRAARRTGSSRRRGRSPRCRCRDARPSRRSRRARCRAPPGRGGPRSRRCRRCRSPSPGRRARGGPGGRTSANPPTSTARMAHPAASRAASQVVGWPIVSPSSQHSSPRAAMRAT